MVSAIEHKAALDACYASKAQGKIQLTILSVNNKAQLDLSALDAICKGGVRLICVVATNNKVRTIYDKVRRKLAILTGSTCTSGVEEPSHVLTAMGLPDDVVEGSLRIDLGKFTTDEEVEEASKILTTEVKAIRTLLT